MKKSIDNFILEGWEPTPLERSLMDGTFGQMITESADQAIDEIPIGNNQ